jgi:hypothetical protein
VILNGPGGKGERYEYLMPKEEAKAWLELEKRQPKPVRR